MGFAVSIFFMVLLLLPISTIAQTSRNVTLGSSLTADSRRNSSWTSPSGDFAFGFQQVASGGYLLAVWFNRIPERTIVWSANRNDLAPRGSTVQFTASGRLELNDPSGRQIWNANIARSGVAYAAMLDTGNFVLVTNDLVTSWQSFDEPTDTLLPTQIMNQGGRLISSFSRTNFSYGRFQFTLQTDGNLVSYVRNYPLDAVDAVNGAYTATMTMNTGYQVIFNQSGYLYLTAENGTLLNMVLSNAASTRQFYQRVILEFDGVLRQYVYPKSAAATGGRPMAWSVLSFTPSNICLRIPESTGGGACGFNSLCEIGTDQRPSCLCPSGYAPIDPGDHLSGCRPNFVPQSCNRHEDDHFEFIDMPNTDWAYGDYEHYRTVTEDWCREICLSDCFCAVAIFNNGECWKKKNPVSNGRVGPSVGGKALIKVRTANSSLESPGGNRRKKDHTTLIITGSVLLGSSVFLNCLLFLSAFFVFYYHSRKAKEAGTYSVVPGINLQIFTYKELEEATNGFKEELGKGAFSTVYKGMIKNANGNVIAVKKLDKLARENEQEFETEMRSISKTNHKNLVRLLGYCKEGQHRILVYECMSNGSLAGFLFGESRPNWFTRVQIAFGTARGLNYLHQECSTQIIHCDIKPQNILLDESFTAKISDFGLAKLLKTDQTRTATAIRGTKGYVAPEWFKNLPVTVKVDVYSFGVLLLELICCRRNVETDLENENEMILSDWACDCFREGNLHVLVKNDEEAMEDVKGVEKFVMIAIWCIQEDPSLRPTMKKVLQMLEGSVEVSVPPDPTSFISSI